LKLSQLFVYSLQEKTLRKMTKRRYVPRKKLGSKRIDLPLTKKKEYLRRIITLKQPYSEVKKIYMKEFGKDLHHNTFRREGLKIIRWTE
jgi:hypothetical protein